MEFKTIRGNATAEIIEKKSKFIANCFYVSTEKEAVECIKKIKKKYYDAKHNCFAYIITDIDGNTIKKFSDDGEPAGTAGVPILDLLSKQGLSNVLIIVTRYFGGILLGTGGLLRAYSESAKEVLTQIGYIYKSVGYEISIDIEYKDLAQLKYYLEKNKIKIIKIDYKENIKLTLEIPKEKLILLTNENENLKVNVIKNEILSKKYVEI